MKTAGQNYTEEVFNYATTTGRPILWTLLDGRDNGRWIGTKTDTHDNVVNGWGASVIRSEYKYNDRITLPCVLWLTDEGEPDIYFIPTHTLEVDTEV